MVSDGFDYEHMGITIYSVKNLSSIDPSYSISGYYFLTAIISEISGISYDIIPTLPIQSMSFIFLLIMLLKNITKRSSTSHLLIMGLIIIFITKFGFIKFFGYFFHEIGFILSLLVISLTTLRHRSELRNQKEISFILIIAIISINYISYKMAFFTIGFLAILQIIEWVCYYRFSTKTDYKKSNFMIVIIIGVVHFLTFKKEFYDHFIPRMRFSSKITTSGIYKFLLRFQYNPFDSLDQYYLRSPKYTLYANMIWLSLLFIVLGLLSITLIQKFIKKENFSVGEIIISAITMSGLFILIIYTYIGLSDITFLVFSCIIGIAILYDSTSKDHSKFFTFFICLLIVLNIYTTINTYDNYHDGIRDWNYCNYIKSSSEWYLKYMINGNSKIYETTATDVYTRSYFGKEIAKESKNPSLYTPYIFSREHMLFLLKQNIGISEVSNSAFVINYRVHHIQSQNWETFISWSNSTKVIENNLQLNSVHSSGDIIIYLTTK